ncbi:MAG TPA: peptidyl-prolyl cis-trans isomerase [Verrucomicrobiae bacterium]|jgi:peptidyl-prolyl cis-trans isomerase D|nr:peptidyl-prolyl cis-trans isomerase [Verrucomicrobiae bacterium]
MAGSSDNTQKIFSRIFLGVVVLALSGGMLLYLVPTGPGDTQMSTDAVAKVGDQTITVAEIRQQLNQIKQTNQVPPMLEPYYAQRILQQLLLQKEMEYEAGQLGIRVSNDEIADRIKLILPAAFNGDSPIAPDQYASLVQSRTQMSVPQFEEMVRQGMLQEKFQKLVTDGISAGPAEIQEEFVYRNQKVKLDYAYIKPEDLQAKITVGDAEVSAAYEKSKAKYQVPEKRVVRYAILDVNQIRQSVQISDDQLKAQYQKNIQDYQVPNRVHVEHILLMTVGKPDAEVEEIRKKAQDILNQAKKGANFEELAKKYSEDGGTPGNPGSRDKGGDLGWIVQGQTVPEFEKAAFSLPKGSISDLIKTQYGFHIIKIIDKEAAHTKPFDEVKESIRAPLLLSEADKQAGDIADKLSQAIRQSNKVSLDDLAKQYHLSTGETRPVAATDPLLELGNSTQVKVSDAIFQLRQGELSLPLQTDRGYLVLSLKQVLPAHQGSLEEVREKVVADLKQEKASLEARTKAEELTKRTKAGEKFDAAAKALGLEAKTSDDFARSGSIPNVASGKQLEAAFQLKTGDVGAPLNLGPNWLVYKVVDKEEPKPEDFDKQKKELTDSVLQSKRSIAFEAFRTALEDRLKKEGKLKLMPEKLRNFGEAG